MKKSRRKSKIRCLPALVISAGFLLCLAAGLSFVDMRMRASLAPEAAPVFSAAADAHGLYFGFFGRELALPLGWLEDILRSIYSLWADMPAQPPGG